MANFGLGFFEKLVVGWWGFKASKRIYNEQINKPEAIDMNGYSTAQARVLMETASRSPNFNRWYGHLYESGLSTEDIIKTICHYDSNQYFYYFGTIKPV